MDISLKNPFVQKGVELTIQQVSKELGVPPGTIRQWEKDFNLDVGRDGFFQEYLLTKRLWFYKKLNRIGTTTCIKKILQTY
jgi:DNA-binding transcriptional MerR regulator